MSRYIKYISAILLAVMCCLPMVVAADENEYEPVVSVDSFVIDSNENEQIKATMFAKADHAEAIQYDYTVSVVTDISQDGKQVAKGSGTTGEFVQIDIDMSRINSNDSYRFKIMLTYTVDGKDEFATAISKVFAFTQESYADNLKGRDITVDMTGGMVTVDWNRYMSYGADGVLVIIEQDGEKKVEEIIYKDTAKYYKHYFDKDVKEIKVTLKQVIDGELSEGITDTLTVKKGQNPDEFYLLFPEGSDRYNLIWSVQYKNAEDMSVMWKGTGFSNTSKLNGDGTHVIDMKEDNEYVYVEYTDKNAIKWTYEFATDLATYAPDIDLLEAYNGTTVKSSSIILAGKVSDTTATVTLNGKETKVDGSGMFQGEVLLQTGKNVITIEATSTRGKASRKSLTIYKESGGMFEEAGSFFAQYAPLIITLTVSVVFIVVLILSSKKKGGKKGEKQA